MSKEEENEPIEPKANYWTFCFKDETGNKKFKPQLAADWLKANYHFKTDKVTDMLFYGDAKTGITDTKNKQLRITAFGCSGVRCSVAKGF